MTPPLPHQKFEFIFYLRAFSALLVFWAHIGDWWATAHGYSWWAQLAFAKFVSDPLRLYHFGGHLGVILFFLLSGFVITHASLKESQKAFFVRRVFRIYPPLIFAIIVMLICVPISTYLAIPVPIGISSDKITDAILNVTLIGWWIGSPWTLMVTWTLFIEVSFYLITFICIPKTKTNPVTATYLSLILTLAFFLPFQLGLPIGEFYLDRIIYLPILITGRCLYFYHQTKAIKWTLHAIISWVLFAVLTQMRPGDGLFGSQHPPIYTYVIATAIFVIGMSMKKIRAIGPVKFFSDISYSMYLLHLPIGSIALGYMLSCGFGFSLSFLFSFVIVIISSWLSFVFIENPFRSWGVKISKRPTMTAAASKVSTV